MKKPVIRKLRCAVYTRVSTDAGLEQDFNSLDAQREAAEAYIKSQAHEGWRLVRQAYDDAGFSGGSLELFEDAGLIRLRNSDAAIAYTETGYVGFAGQTHMDRLSRPVAERI